MHGILEKRTSLISINNFSVPHKRKYETFTNTINKTRNLWETFCVKWIQIKFFNENYFELIRCAIEFMLRRLNSFYGWIVICYYVITELYLWTILSYLKQTKMMFICTILHIYNIDILNYKGWIIELLTDKNYVI